MAKFAYAPNGSPILGTLENLTGRAEIRDGSFRMEDGALAFDHAGETEVFWDGQETVSRDGKTVFLAADGNEVLEDQIVLEDKERAS